MNRNAADKDIVQLHKVLGFAGKSNQEMALNPQTGELVWVAGSVIVTYSPKENKQTKFIFHPSNKSFGCLTFSPNGKYLAAGGKSKNPSILVYEFSYEGSATLVADLKGHTYGIQAVQFSNNLDYLVSLGDRIDQHLILWDWKK